MAAPRAGSALALLALGLQAGLASAFGWFSTCCGSPMGGTCADGSVGNPCCGKGGCNAMCCGCDGGCKTKKEAAPVYEISTDMLKLPFNQWPMLMAHDAASSYAQSDTCSVRNPVNNWAVTQSRGGFGHMLQCGARALDVRPYVKKDGHVVMHHGKVLFETPLSEALQDIIEWADEHPGTFVLIMMSHCETEDGTAQTCWSKAEKAVKEANIANLDCEAIGRMTVQDAINAGKPKSGNGGSVLQTWSGCVKDNYDSSISCYGQAAAAAHHAMPRKLGDEELEHTFTPLSDFASELQPYNASSAGGDLQRQLADAAALRQLSLVGKMTCYGSAHDQSVAFKPFWDYMDSKTNTAQPPWDRKNWLWMAQAHWQYSTESIAEGTARHSCILWDGSWGRVPLRRCLVDVEVAEKIRAGAFKHLNMLEVDHVCNHGDDIAEALHGHAARRLAELQEKFAAGPGAGALAGGRARAVAAAAALLSLGALAWGALAARRRGRRAAGSSAVAAGPEEVRKSLVDARGVAVA